MARYGRTLLAVAFGFTLVSCRDVLPTQLQVSNTSAPEHSGRYIVVFRPGVADVRASANALLRGRGELLFAYTHAFKGFAARMAPAAASAIERNPNVASVTADRPIFLETTQMMGTGGEPWGLDRTDATSTIQGLSLTYSYTSTGAGVHAYIIDSGIWTAHSQFGGRASNVFDAFGGNGQDCFGHGTHVAGTVGASTWGVAKQVVLHGLRVFDCNGGGFESTVLAGVDWVMQNHVAPAVVNMSLIGPASSQMNAAVQAMADSGIFVAVAAGNYADNACSYSPASATGVMTVAAIQKNFDTRASYSNHGACVDLYAPGSNIWSTWLNGEKKWKSGTSMATPHVTGVAALYKAAFGDSSQATIAAWIVSHAQVGQVTQNPAGTPNLLLNKSTL